MGRRLLLEKPTVSWPVTRGQSGVWERKSVWPTGTLVEMVSCRNFPGIVLSTATTMVSGKRRSGHASSVWQSVPNGLCCRLPLYCWHHCWCLAVPLQALRQRSAQPLQGRKERYLILRRRFPDRKRPLRRFPRRGIPLGNRTNQKPDGDVVYVLRSGRTFEEAEDRGTVELSGLDVTTGQGIG